MYPLMLESAWFLVISWESGFGFTSSMTSFEQASCYWFAWLFSRSWRHSLTAKTVNLICKVSQKIILSFDWLYFRLWMSEWQTHITENRSWFFATAGSDKCWCAAAKAEEGRVATFWIWSGGEEVAINCGMIVKCCQMLSSVVPQFW